MYKHGGTDKRYLYICGAKCEWKTDEIIKQKDIR